MTLTNFLFAILLLMRIVIAVLLTITSLRQESRPVLWFAGVFYISIIISLFGIGINIPPLYNVLFQYLAQVCLVMFLQNTFYTGKDRLIPSLFMGMSLLAFVLGVFFALNNTRFMISVEASSLLPITIAALLNWGWYAAAAWNEYKATADDRGVQDWVKSRYKLMTAYSLLFLIPTALAPFASRIPLVVFLLTFVVLVLQYLVWGMPEPLRRWLNRNPKSGETA